MAKKKKKAFGLDQEIEESLPESGSEETLHDEEDSLATAEGQKPEAVQPAVDAKSIPGKYRKFQ